MEQNEKKANKVPYNVVIGVVLGGILVVGGITYAIVHNNNAQKNDVTSAISTPVATKIPEKPIVSNAPITSNSPSTGGFVQKKEPPVSPSNKIEDVMPGKAPEYVKTKLSFEQIRKIMQEVANKEFGENAMVIPTETEAISIDINGEKRPCFFFAADKEKSNGEISNIYYVDGNTGEVFKQSTDGTKKVN